MTGNKYDSGPSDWWEHNGATALTTYPLDKLGNDTDTHTDSLCYGARCVILYGWEVTSAVALDTLDIGLTNSAGVFTALAGFSGLDIGTAGNRASYPGGVRIEADSANLSARTGDVSVVTLYYAIASGPTL